MTILSSQ